MRPVDGHGEYLAPRDVCKLLQCSRSLIRKYEAQGRLHPYIDPDGVHRFHRAEVIAIAQQRQVPIGRVQGELAARVFAMFDEQRTLADIVQKTHQSPSTIRALYDEYRRPLGAPPMHEVERQRAADDAEHERVMTPRRRGAAARAAE